MRGLLKSRQGGGEIIRSEGKLRKEIDEEK